MNAGKDQVDKHNQKTRGRMQLSGKKSKQQLSTDKNGISVWIYTDTGLSQG